jgi:hypothetical protein
MANIVNPELVLEKSIVIDSKTAKELEARGTILQSDAYIERERGETLAPAQFVQETVDAATAAKLAAARGISLPTSVDAAANVSLGTNPILHPEGGTHRESKMPTAILESFKKQPPLAPTSASTVPEFEPEFLKSIQDYNQRLNKVGGDIALRVPKNASPPVSLMEERNIDVSAYTQRQFVPQPATSAIDYSVISAIIKEAVREVMKDINIKEVVKDVLKEERENIVKQNINENIQIKVGEMIFSGRLTTQKTTKK